MGGDVAPVLYVVNKDKKNHLYKGKYRWPNTLRGKRLTHKPAWTGVIQTKKLYRKL